MIPLDLHCHSTASDGALSPADLVTRVAGRGGRVLALTDHDCTAGLAEARATAATHGIRFINGAEVSVTWRKRTLHIVGLGIDPDCQVLADGLYSIRHGRIDRAREMAADLVRVGIDDAFAGAMRFCSNPEMIGRTHFARYLVESGKAKDTQQVFKRYLVIAHPGRYKIGKRLMLELVEEFKAAGGEGIEVVSGSHSASEIPQFAHLARSQGLLASSGSDFHAPGEGGRDVGYTLPLPAGCVPV
ncbi:MAG: PHP domain-containing protein, partial [Microvirgula sp.]